jgi:hypothetical protein
VSAVWARCRQVKGIEDRCGGIGATCGKGQRLLGFPRPRYTPQAIFVPPDAATWDVCAISDCLRRHKGNL